MNQPILPAPVREANPILCPEDAAAIAAYHAPVWRPGPAIIGPRPLPVFRVTDDISNREAAAWGIAALLQDLVKQKKSGMKTWYWANGTGKHKRISDSSVIEALSTRAIFKRLDPTTNTWQLVPCPMGYAMAVFSALYSCGGRKP